MIFRRLKIRARLAWARHWKLRHRKRGYRLLRAASASGIEIGAFYLPARVPRGCRVEYCDALTSDEARRRFPELADYPLARVEHVLDLDRGGLGAFASGSRDFVVINHVIEHVANPIRVLGECVRVLCRGGHLVITAPDKDYTVDRARAITPFEHLLAEFRAGVTEVSDEHYLDFIRAVRPHLLEDPRALAGELADVRARREHAHVWDSGAFRDFLERAFREALGARLSLRYESRGRENGGEYFSVWVQGA